jgi:hypothetical protein
LLWSSPPYLPLTGGESGGKKSLILGATTTGDLLFADANLTMHRLRVTDEAITAIALDASGAALIGSASGEVCVWGVLDLP